MGKTPTEWIQNNLLQSQIMEISKDNEYEWNNIHGIDKNLNGLINIFEES